jgi:hypothetical protein
VLVPVGALAGGVGALSLQGSLLLCALPRQPPPLLLLVGSLLLTQAPVLQH